MELYSRCAAYLLLQIFTRLPCPNINEHFFLKPTFPLSGFPPSLASTSFQRPSSSPPFPPSLLPSLPPPPDASLPSCLLLISSFLFHFSSSLWTSQSDSCRLVDELIVKPFIPSFALYFLLSSSLFCDDLSLNTTTLYRLIKEFSVKACKECCFSHGGHYFAAVNGNTISIYNTYTFENVGNLRSGTVLTLQPCSKCTLVTTPDPVGLLKLG